GDGGGAAAAVAAGEDEHAAAGGGEEGGKGDHGRGLAGAADGEVAGGDHAEAVGAHGAEGAAGVKGVAGGGCGAECELRDGEGPRGERWIRALGGVPDLLQRPREAHVRARSYIASTSRAVASFDGSGTSRRWPPRDASTMGPAVGAS